MRYILSLCAVPTCIHLDFPRRIYKHTTDAVQLITNPIIPLSPLSPTKLCLIFRNFFFAILNLIERTHIIRENNLVLHVRTNAFKVGVLGILGFHVVFNDVVDVVVDYDSVFAVAEKRIVRLHKEGDDVRLLVLFDKSHRVFVDGFNIKVHFYYYRI